MKTKIISSFSILVLIILINPVFGDKDKNDLTKYDVDVLCDAWEDYEENKKQCDKLYDQLKDSDKKMSSEEWNEKDYKETMKKHDRNENDQKDNKNEDKCFYEGFRVDNDNSFCD